MGIYDLPAAIDLVISVTGYSKVDVGGVSLGGTIPLITLAEKPEYNAKIRNLLLMAPATRMGSGFQGFQFFFARKMIRRILVITIFNILIFILFHSIAFKCFSWYTRSCAWCNDFNYVKYIFFRFWTILPFSLLVLDLKLENFGKLRHFTKEFFHQVQKLLIIDEPI